MGLFLKLSWLSDAADIRLHAESVTGYCTIMLPAVLTVLPHPLFLILA